MLSLKAKTSDRWLAQVERDLDEVLLDHAHCERKAAATALNLLSAYGAHQNLVAQMSQIVAEEIAHFGQVLDHLARRGTPYRPQQPGGYGKRLGELVQKGEPARAIDRLLIAGLIEARSCERFALMSRHVSDAALAEFYAGLFESEARHHSTYVQLALELGRKSAVRVRLAELADAEASIIAAGDPLPRMHS